MLGLLNGGLEQGLADLFDFDLAWVSDIDKGACKILAHRYPDTPNLGDFTTATGVEPVDVLTAGFPCQPVSHAGKRAGTDDERWLFDDITRLVGLLDPRPGLLVFENVLGLLSANRGHAMARVVHGLAQVGYVGCWRTLRASDVGAPHRRERVFIVATPADPRGETERLWPGLRASQPRGIGRGRPDHNGSPSLLPTPEASLGEHRRDYGQPPDRRREGGHAVSLADVTCYLPTPRATDGTKGGPNQRGSSGDLMLPSAVVLLPTPSVSDGTGGHLSRSGDRSHELLLPGVAKSLALLPTPTTAPTTGNGHARNLGVETRLLPTPRASDGPDATSHARSWSTTDRNLHNIAREQSWGDYAPAIARWETTIGRAAPPPTETGPKGSPRLSPRFVEWMQGLPEGWVTDVPDLTRNEQLKALGNGVVPQQAAAAVGWLLDQIARQDVA